MNNFFLLNEALSFKDFDNGILNLNEIIFNSDSLKDNFLKHQSLLNHQTNKGFFIDIINNSSKGALFWKIFRNFKEIPYYFNSLEQFNDKYKNECNGFLGFDFNSLEIEKNNQVVNLSDFYKFKNNCTQNFILESFDSFWKNRKVFFKGLEFCESVYNNISHFSVDDNRFMLIKEKLKRLNETSLKWKSGSFPHYQMGLKVSPDTKTRLIKSSTTRNFICPDNSIKEFSWHIKLSVGIDYRIYYYPDSNTQKVIIGVIGTKSELGF
jgi:hypothetical protein